MIEDGQIRYFNRYTQALETEEVYGDKALRWAYETAAGRLATNLVVSRVAVSRLYGWWMDRRRSRRLIPQFVAQYGLDPSTFEKRVEDFASFNDFFTRKLKPEARPVDADPLSIVFPADARHLGFARAVDITRVFVKNTGYSLASLIGDDTLTGIFAGGPLVLSRLCPVDYHRYHFPLDCVPDKPALVNGRLWSVNPVALYRRLSILSENKRARALLHDPETGQPAALMIEIGATFVGSIRQTYTPEHSARKGDEKGAFAFGGSSIVTLFPAGTITLCPDLLEHSEQGVELYARMGDVMGYKAE